MNQAPRIVVRLELTPDAKQALSQVAERSGMTQLSVNSRIMEWFAKQPVVIQAAVLGNIPKEIAGDTYKLILEHLSKAA